MEERCLSLGVSRTSKAETSHCFTLEHSLCVPRIFRLDKYFLAKIYKHRTRESDRPAYYMYVVSFGNVLHFLGRRRGTMAANLAYWTLRGEMAM